MPYYGYKAQKLSLAMPIGAFLDPQILKYHDKWRRPAFSYLGIEVPYLRPGYTVHAKMSIIERHLCLRIRLRGLPSLKLLSSSLWAK